MKLEDAVYELLGIPVDEQPADCYRLLGIARFEPSSDVIRNASARQSLFVRQMDTGPHSSVSQQLLDMIAAARKQLLNPSRKKVYDDMLRSQSDSAAAPDGPLPPGDSSPSGWGSTAAGGKGGPSAFGADPAPRVIASFDPSADESVVAGGEATRAGESPRHWVIGADVDCDIIVRCPYVSRRHCRIWETEGLFWVEDLGSRNGTHVNRQRLEGRQVVTGDDVVTLGTLARMPWPPEATPAGSPSRQVEITRIGRASTNDVVLKDPSVSRRHAQLSDFGDHLVIEDLGSTNGIYVGESALRVNRRRVDPADSVRIGRFHCSVQQLMAGEPIG